MIPREALDQHSAIIGCVGSGKTYTAKGAVETLLAEARHVVIIDPTGAWWGLKSSADGLQPGHPVVVFGGTHADVPISDDRGADLAAIVVERRISCIIDTSDFSEAGQQRFATAFFVALYEALKRRPAPLYLVIDEADIFAPQEKMRGEERMMGSVKQLVRRGRIDGVRTIMITQRPASLNKNVLTQIGMLVVMKVTAPQDRRAVEDWINGHADPEAGREVLASLARLPTGEGWIWWPAGDRLERAQFPRITTFDSSRTPGHEDAPLAAPVLAEVDMAGLRDLFAAPQAASASAADTAAAEQRGYERGLAEGRRRGAAEAATAWTAERARMLADISQAIGHLMPHQTVRDCGPPPAPAERAAPVVIDAADIIPRLPASPLPGTGLPPYAASILLVLLQRHPAAQSEGAWAMLAKRSDTSSAWKAARNVLVRAGYVAHGGGRWRVTEHALARYGDGIPPPESGAALLRFWLGRLSKTEAGLLQAIARGPCNRVEVSARSGYSLTSSSFKAGLSTLREYDLIEVQGDLFCLAEALRDAGDA